MQETLWVPGILFVLYYPFLLQLLLSFLQIILVFSDFFLHDCDGVFTANLAIIQIMLIYVFLCALARFIIQRLRMFILVEIDFEGFWECMSQWSNATAIGLGSPLS